MTAVELEIMRGRLQSIVDEGGAALMRTAFSAMVREARDFACAILTPDGRSVVQPVQSIPVFLGTMTYSAQALLERFPPDGWRPGDVVATNDPWIGTGHLYDIVILRPIFFADELIAFAAVIAHLPDVGGKAGFGLAATQMFEEGLRIPPLKIGTADGIDPTLVELVRANVRVPEQVLGDIDAVLNAAAVIERRVIAICAAESLAAFQETCRQLELRTERFMRDAVAALPDGSGAASVQTVGSAGVPLEIHLRVTIRGDELEIDFGGSSPQLPAPMNSCFAYTQAYCLYALKCVLAPGLPFNDGIGHPIRVVAPEGSVVNSRFPAAGASRNLVGHFIPGLVFKALEQFVPGSAMAESGAPRPIITVSGATDDGTHFVTTMLLMGGLGARPDRDGPSAMVFPTNTRSVPVEVVEATAPIRIAEKQLITDSGGVGEHRGGLGQRITFSMLTGGPTEIAIAAERLHDPPQGQAGGGPGSVTRLVLNGRALEEVPRSLIVGAGDVLTIESPGGGGYGAPRDRDPALVAADVADGYVSIERAAGHHGLASERSDHR